MNQLTEEKINQREAYLRAQYKALGHENGITEIRFVKTGKQIFVRGEEEFVKTAKSFLSGDVYVGINPRENEAGTSEDVHYITCLVFDFDPVRDAGTPSTLEQWEEAISQAYKFSSETPNSFVVSSGSGAHAYLPIVQYKVRENDETLKKLDVYYRRIQERYKTENVHVDSINDLPRVIRIWGSLNEKSSRVCQPYDDVIDSPIQRTSLDVLVAGISVEEEKKVKSQIYADHIPNGFRNKALASLAGSMRRRGFSQEGILAALIEENRTKCNPPLSEQEVKNISQSISRYEPTKELSNGIKTMSEEYFKGLDERKPGILIGLEKLDSRLAGLKPGRLYVVAARPNEGKTTFLTQIAKNLAIKNLKVLFFPTECGASSIYDKIVSSEADINLRKFQFGSFSESEKVAIQKSKESLLKMSVIVAEDFGLTITKIEQKIKEIMPDVVIIDYLQALKFENGGEPGELGKAVVDIKSFSSNYKIPIILASQLNRGSELNKSSLTQLKGSGVIEEAADDVIFLTTLDKLSYPRSVLLSIMKSRYGETGIIKMNFFSSVCTFKEREDEE